MKNMIAFEETLAPTVKVNVRERLDTVCACVCEVQIKVLVNLYRDRSWQDTRLGE